MSSLKNLSDENLKERLEKVSKEYKLLAERLVPMLREANNYEKEMNLLISELQSRQ